MILFKKYLENYKLKLITIGMLFFISMCFYYYGSITLSFIFMNLIFMFTIVNNILRKLTKTNIIINSMMLIIQFYLIYIYLY